MIDCFALLNEPRRPWLDVDSLKGRFLALSSEVHPDRVHNASEREKQAAHARYAELNAAYNTLKDPKNRLHHLLELERGSTPSGIEKVPSDTMELFAQVGQLCRNADIFIAGRAKVTAPLLKVQMFQHGMEWIEQLNGLQQILLSRHREIEEHLRALNIVWEDMSQPDAPARSLSLDRLEEHYRQLSFLNRWVAQLQNRIVTLSI